VLLGDFKAIKEGDQVKRTGRSSRFPSWMRCRRVVNALGQPLDGKGPITTNSFADRASAPGVVDWQPVRNRCRPGSRRLTGMVPTDAASAELIIGDRQTGKPRWPWTLSSTSGQGASCAVQRDRPEGSRQSRSGRTLEEFDAMNSRSWWRDSV